MVCHLCARSQVGVLKDDYRDLAVPNFLFYVDGEYKQKVTGANIPAIKKAIDELAPTL